MLFSLLKISGHSMEPTILNGQSVLASSLPFLFGSPKEGDIIVFKREQKIIVKRIREVKNDKILVAGDNEKDSKDFGWIKKSDIMGKVIFK